MKNLAIITARSGSKGLKNKNIKLLNGKPLMAYSIDAAKKSEIFAEVMVSTDSEEYARIAKEWGAEVPFLRSEVLSNDVAGSWDVVKEVLQKYAERGEYFDTVCLLQPTSPLRTFEDIQKGYQVFEDKEADSVVAVCETDHSPLLAAQLPEDHSMCMFSTGLRRQDMPTYYRINGALYIRKIEYSENIGLLNEKSYAYIMDRARSVDIDEEIDFTIAEVMMNYCGCKS